MKIKISKSQWQEMGRKAGWEEEARKRGLNSDDAYDVKRDYGNNLEEAKRDSQQSTVKENPFITFLDQKWTDKSSPDYKSLKERIEKGEFKSIKHLENSINKRLKTPSKPEEPKSKFQPDTVPVRKGLWTEYKPVPLSPELEKEAKRQRIEMTDALVQEAGLERRTAEMPSVVPFGKPQDYYNPQKNKEILMKGVAVGKWDKYLAEEMLKEMERSYDISIR